VPEFVKRRYEKEQDKRAAKKTSTQNLLKTPKVVKGVTKRLEDEADTYICDESGEDEAFLKYSKAAFNKDEHESDEEAFMNIKDDAERISFMKKWDGDDLRLASKCKLLINRKEI
jgi:hypothetical protein